MTQDKEQCDCDCHQPLPVGWDSVECCPDCGASLIQIGLGDF